MSSPRHLAAIAGASALALAATVALGSGAAHADNPLAPRTAFTMVVNPVDGTTDVPSDGEAVPNVDSVKATIRAYYNASGGASSKTGSRYITQVRSIENQILRALPAAHPGGQAVVFDVDDTLLWNYDYEDGGSNFNYNPATNLAAVKAGFPAVPGMPALLRTLHDRGYLLYGVTGRPGMPDPAATPAPDNQEPLTLSNLAAQGFTVDGTPGGTPLLTADTLYTKDAAANPATLPQTIPTQPWVDCAADGTPTSCSTVEYKALTRAHIIENGTPGDPSDDLDIAMNVGDQLSDLQGGYADEVTKIPNPTYFLASPDIAGAPASDANLVAPTSYVMAPDGSSGYAVASGDDIPNIDPVRKAIRSYYRASTTAPAGIADKTTSPYITQLAALEATWTDQVTTNCATGATAYRTAVTRKSYATAAVAAASSAVGKDAKIVAKAKKAVRKAMSRKARKRAHHKLRRATASLTTHRTALTAAQAALAGATVPGQPAVVLDADDTTLWNYDLEDNVLAFVYNATTAGTYVSGQLFPAVPGMVGVVRAAKASGCAIFGVTGRPTSQQADTVANLAKDGYVDAAGAPLFTDAQFFTKGPVVVAHGNASIPTEPWVDCGSDSACSTVEVKSATRGHIESLGYDVVGNFGDQYSDLIGGYADHVYKVPNPTYYLP